MVESQLKLIDLLSQFELGRFLLTRGGLNGYWTDYIVKHPRNGRLSRLNNENRPLNPLEAFLLDRAPTVLATQQRLKFLKQKFKSGYMMEFPLPLFLVGSWPSYLI